MAFVNPIKIARILTHFKMEIAPLQITLSKLELQMPLEIEFYSETFFFYPQGWQPSGSIPWALFGPWNLSLEGGKLS